MLFSKKTIKGETIMYTMIMKLKEFEKEAVEFGERLRIIRTQKGISQEQLARMAGTSQRMIAHYESRIKRPSIDKVKKFAVALGISVEELLGVSKQTIKQSPQEKVSLKIMKRVKIIEQLPTRDQNAVFHFINSLVEKNKLKGKL